MITSWYNTTTPPLPAPNLTPHAEYLFSLINEQYSTMFNPIDFIIGAPTASTIGSMYNTSVSITGVPDAGYVDTLSYQYNRIDISTILNQQLGAINLTGMTLLSQILPQINILYGTSLVATDIIDTALPVINPLYPNTPLVVTIVTVTNSLKYTGTYNYILNSAAVQEVIPVDLRKILVAYNGISTLTASIVRYNIDGTVDSSFNFANNVSNIVSFSITNMFYQPSGVVVINGVFDCTTLIGGVATPGTYASLVIDQTGTVLSATVTPYYNFPINTQTFTNRNVNYIYAINTVFSRYTASGVIDTTYVPNLPYVPVYASVAASGNVYVVSAPFTGPDPYNNSVSTQLVRIDRLLPTGMVDPIFTPQLLRSSVLNNTDITVQDISENSQGNIAILLTSVDGFNVGTPTVVINGVPLVPYNSNGLTITTWMPIISLLNNGQINPNYTAVVNIYSGGSISGSPTVLNTAMSILNYTPGSISWLTYKLNPITSLYGIQPFYISASGAYGTYDGDYYINWPLLSLLYSADWYSDNTLVIAGKLGTVNINGQYSIPRDIVTIIQPNGLPVPINTPVTGSFPTGTITINSLLTF